MLDYRPNRLFGYFVSVSGHGLISEHPSIRHGGITSLVSVCNSYLTYFLFFVIHQNLPLDGGELANRTEGIGFERILCLNAEFMPTSAAVIGQTARLGIAFAVVIGQTIPQRAGQDIGLATMFGK